MVYWNTLIYNIYIHVLRFEFYLKTKNVFYFYLQNKKVFQVWRKAAFRINGAYQIGACVKKCPPKQSIYNGNQLLELYPNYGNQELGESLKCVEVKMPIIMGVAGTCGGQQSTWYLITSPIFYCKLALYIRLQKVLLCQKSVLIRHLISKPSRWTPSSV